MPFFTDAFLSLSAAQLEESIKMQTFQVNDMDDRYEGYALTIAAGNDRLDLVRVLLRHNADTMVTDIDNRTALMNAMLTGNLELIELLDQLSPQVNQDELAFKESMDSGDLEKLHLSFQKVKTNNVLIKQESKNLLQRIQNEPEEICISKWIPVAEFLYEHSNAYQAVVKKMCLYAEHDTESKLGVGFLIKLYDHCNVAGLKMILKQGFRTDSPQYFHKDCSLNALQAIIVLYKPNYLLSVQALLEHYTSTQFNKPSSIQPKNLIKQPHVDNTEELVLSRSENSVQLLINKKVPDLSHFFNQLSHMDNALKLALTTTTYHEPDLLMTLADHVSITQLFEAATALLVHAPVTTRVIHAPSTQLFQPEVYLNETLVNKVATTIACSTAPTNKLKTYLLFFIDDTKQTSITNRLAQTASALLRKASKCFAMLSGEEKNKLLINLTNLGQNYDATGQDDAALNAYRSAQLVYSMIDNHTYKHHQQMAQLFTLRIPILKRNKQYYPTDPVSLEYISARHFINALVDKPNANSNEMRIAFKATPLYVRIMRRTKDYVPPILMSNKSGLFRQVINYCSESPEIHLAVEDDSQQSSELDNAM